VEAVILLPTLVILLLGARFITRRYEGEIRALGEARSCAARFAFSGCRTVPAGCTATVVSPKAPNPGGAEANVSEKLGRAAATLKQLSSIPVLGDAVDALFGRIARSERAVVVQGLDRTTNAVKVVRARALFPCNEVSRADDVAKQVFNAVTAPFL
jgi:hypothetical protein